MKGYILILGISLAGTTMLPSCTKNLKDDVSDLQTQVDSLKKRNAELRDHAKATQNILGSDEPIAAVTSYKDDAGADKSYQDTYSFKAGNYSTQYMVERTDGTYEVYVERFGDVEWYEGAWFYFRYNPTTKEVTQKSGGQYWSNASRWFNVYYYDTYTGNTVTINLKSINIATGELSLDFTGSATADYTTNNSNFPNPGVAHNTKFPFTGKLAVLKKD